MTTESVPASGPGSRTDLRPAGPGRGVTAAFVLAYLGFWLAFFTPILLSLQLQAQRLAPGNPAGTVSLVLGVSSVFGIVTNPVAGRLSDRTTSRFGRRRPWLLGYVLLGLVGLVVMALAPGVVALVAGACVVQVGFSGGVAVLLALLSDEFPAARRGKVSGLLGVSQAVATLVGVAASGALAAAPLAAFLVPGVVGVLLVGLLCAVLRERLPTEPPEHRPFFSTLWVDPGATPDFGWAWLSRFAIFMAFAGVLNYQVFYLTAQIGVSAEQAASLVGVGIGVQVVMLVITSAVSGALSDRVGRRKPFVVAAAVIGICGLGLVAVATTLPVWAVGMALVGVASGMYYSVDLALVADVLPDRERDAAKNFGVFGIANQLPQTVAPAIAPLFLAITVGSVAAGGDNYTAFFAASAVFALISAVTIVPVRGVR